MQNTYNYRWTLSLQIQTGLLTSDFGPCRHKEKDTILKVYANHNMLTSQDAWRIL